MRITIVGVGAIGCLFGAKLSPHAQVRMLGTWREGVAAIQERGIRVETAATGEMHSVRAFATDDPSAVGECDLALIARKAWQTPGAAEQAKRILAPDGIALTLQNGLGNLETLAAAVGSERAALGVTTQGSALPGPGHIRYAGGGPTHIGVTPHTRVRLEAVADLFARAGFETHSADDVQSLLWGKLAINCGINALTALLRLPNGELLNRPDTDELMVRAASECVKVAHAKGISLPYSDPAARVREVAHATAANRSSMFQDILRHAPTEIEAINGAVVREGERLGVPTPVNEMLYRLVSALITNDTHGPNGRMARLKYTASLGQALGRAFTKKHWLMNSKIGL